MLQINELFIFFKSVLKLLKMVSQVMINNQYQNILTYLERYFEYPICLHKRKLCVQCLKQALMVRFI